MSDFSDAPFVAGSLIGLRAFGVDKAGRLHGPSFKQVFRPGENEAECRKAEAESRPSYWGGVNGSLFGTPAGFLSIEYERALRRQLGIPNSGGTARLQTTAGEVRVTAKKEEHRVGRKDCTCGFYAYFDGANEYKHPDRISAVIEGFGHCTVGTRGFRAEKARLVGLIMKSSKRQRYHLVMRNYPDVPVYSTVTEAVAAHPLSDLTPSPEDDGFWTAPIR